MKQIFKSIFIICAAYSLYAYADDNAKYQSDLIIFSYDRPMQLEACLRSTLQNVNGIEHIFVIYRSSNERFANAFALVEQQYDSVIFLPQQTPFNDFKQLTMSCLQATDTSYVLFAVDDDIVTAEIDVIRCAQLLETTQAYAFFLRLGLNLSACYSVGRTHDTPQKVPMHSYVADDVISWKFAGAEYDWGYPNNVDMTLYRKVDVINVLKSFDFKNPTQLEGTWAARFARPIMQREGLCFEYSRMVNIPVNVVHVGNRHMNSWSSVQLLEFFESGKRIDIVPLQNIKNPSAHTEYALQFIEQRDIKVKNED